MIDRPARAAELTPADRERLEEQTRRNLEGMELERMGRVDLALELYEQNVEDGFEGDWPYGRLVAFYEREGKLSEATRVLARAIEVFTASKRRPPADRRATVAAFRGRLRLVRKEARDAEKAGRQAAAQGRRHSRRLPMAESPAAH